MTFRPKLSDIEATIERLNRNMESLNSTRQFAKKEYNGYIHLYNKEGSEGYSYGNSKTELYWQLILVNKVLESIRYEDKENNED